MTEHEVFVKARNQVAKGWVQRFLIEGGKVCAVGGVEVGSGAMVINTLGSASLGKVKSVTRNPSLKTLAATIVSKGEHDPEYLGYPSEVIGEWNDRPERTKEQVLALFDELIAATAPEPIDPLADTLAEAEADREALSVG